MGRAESEILIPQMGEGCQSGVIKATGFSESHVAEALARLVERQLEKAGVTPPSPSSYRYALVSL